MYCCLTPVFIQATIEDYEKVPIDQFGQAMLRGMGWKDGEGIGKNKKWVLIWQFYGK